MKTVLMIAPYFVPRRRVGALRPFKFAIHLRKFGWDPVVLKIADPGETMTDLEKNLLGDIRVIEISPPFDRTTRTVSRNVKEPAKKNAAAAITESVSNFIDRNTPMDTWIYLFLMRYRSVYKAVKAADPDMIWCTGDPWSGLWLGERMANALDKPFIADFRDPWTLSKLSLRERSPFSEDRDREIEKKIISRAARVVFTAAGTMRDYEASYPGLAERFEVITNSFCRQLLSSVPAPEVTGRMRDEHLNILFLGEFRRLSPAEPVIRVLNEIQQNRSDQLNNLRIHHFGDLLPAESDLVNRCGLQNHFVKHARILPEQVQSVMQKADLLLLSTSSKRENIIPAKLWDYLSTEKPVISIAPNRDIEEILEETGAGVHFYPEDVSAAADCLADMAILKKEGRVLHKNPAPGISGNGRDKCESEYTTARLASLFDEVISDGRG
jgi:glycosyltransferase involved in cell wall biosynthesis